MAVVRENVPAENFAIDLGSLEHSLRQPRSLFSYVMSFLTGAATIAAMVPLFSVLLPADRARRRIIELGCFYRSSAGGDDGGRRFRQRNRRHVW